ncbi:cystathionine gamma-synthase [Xylariaceae sp. FL0255]|nr:cystathionine gamma-synthase [Xylariaceae sp. FL0255]
MPPTIGTNADPREVEFGYSLPPQGPHTVTMHTAGWDVAMKFRDGDVMPILARMKSIYPRFAPWGPSQELCGKLGALIKLREGYGCVAFFDPQVWAENEIHATDEHRKEHRVEDASVFRYYVVDVASVRLYVLGFPMAKSMGATFEWQHGGRGFSARFSLSLLPHIESATVVGEFPGGKGAPAPTALKEGSSHQAVRERIAGLLNRACAETHEKNVAAGDVFLYQTGMAAIRGLHDVLIKQREGPTVVFASVFHSSYHLFEESPGGIKYYGNASEAEVDEFEKYLADGGKCAYVFTEFPSNPIMVSVDLLRIRKLADKYGFYLVVDDTCAGFANIDVLSAADVVLTSLTKAFSGYADVMGGSVVLNPNTKTAYETLSPVLKASFRNELFEGDADTLLSNSENYLERSVIHNRNATAVAEYFESLRAQGNSVVKQVFYPPYAPGSKNILPFMRKPTVDFPLPGYGCLLSVEFENTEKTSTSYDAINFFKGPHLGAHYTLLMPYAAMLFSKDYADFFAQYGLRAEQLRFSVGLEDEEVLIQRCREAVAKIS